MTIENCAEYLSNDVPLWPALHMYTNDENSVKWIGIYCKVVMLVVVKLAWFYFDLSAKPLCATVRAKIILACSNEG